MCFGGVNRCLEAAGGLQRAIAIFHFCETEVEDLRMAALGDEDIRGLDVAMNNALAVRRVQGLRHFDS